MIRNKDFEYSFTIPMVIAIITHLVILFFFKKSTLNYNLNSMNTFQQTRPSKIEHIEIISQKELEKIKKVGIKNGKKKDYFQPDMLKIPKRPPPATPGLSLKNLGQEQSTPQKTIENIKPLQKNERPKIKDFTSTIIRPSENEAGTIYYNPKKEKKIPRNEDQDNLKQEAYKNLPLSTNNPIADKMSNFEIRYERPEGVSEDELNSDEKAYYSFFKRSYANYLTKLFATYDKVSVSRPGLEKAFFSKHLLIGRIDYDSKGNIILVKILKSSDNDDVHYFFEETLKQLNLPNPPKVFIKGKKQFTTYYQIQIN